MSNKKLYFFSNKRFFCVDYLLFHALKLFPDLFCAQEQLSESDLKLADKFLADKSLVQFMLPQLAAVSRQLAANSPPVRRQFAAGRRRSPQVAAGRRRSPQVAAGRRR